MNATKNQQNPQINPHLDLNGAAMMDYGKSITNLSPCSSPEAGNYPFSFHKTSTDTNGPLEEKARFAPKAREVNRSCGRQNALSFMAITISLICLIITVVLLGLRTVTSSEADTCVPCADISPTLDVNHSMLSSFRREKGGELCCFDNGDQLVQLIKVIGEKEKRRYKTTHPSPFDRPSRNGTYLRAPTVAAHLILKDRRIGRNQRRNDRLVAWDRDSTPAYFLGSGLGEFNGTHIVVLERGYYFVYSQVMFYIRQGDDVHEVFHYMRRANRNYGSRETLFKNEIQLNKMATNLHTSRIGGVLCLRPNDEVYVEISNTNYLYNPTRSEGLHYFGMYKI